MRKVEIKQYENFNKSTVRNTAQNWKICLVRATEGLSAVKAVVQHREQGIRKVRLKKMALCHGLCEGRVHRSPLFCPSIPGCSVARGFLQDKPSDSTNEYLEMGQHTCTHKHSLGINDKCMC